MNEDVDYFFPTEEDIKDNHFKRGDVGFNKQIDMVKLTVADERDGKKLSIWIPAGPFFENINRMAIRRAR